MSRLTACTWTLKHFVEVGWLWILMNFAHGGDLASEIATKKGADGSFPEQQVLDWFVQICLALRLHTLGDLLHWHHDMSDPPT